MQNIIHVITMIRWKVELKERKNEGALNCQNHEGTFWSIGACFCIYIYTHRTCSLRLKYMKEKYQLCAVCVCLQRNALRHCNRAIDMSECKTILIEVSVVRHTRMKRHRDINIRSLASLASLRTNASNSTAYNIHTNAENK